MDGMLSRASVHVSTIFNALTSSDISDKSGGSAREIPVAEKTPEALGKKQRQNAKKREAQKAAKAATETERLAILANHKRELERAWMIEQAQSNKKGQVSGGMKSVVDEQGKLVWE